MEAMQIKRRPHHSAEFMEDIADAQTNHKGTWTEWNKLTKSIPSVSSAQSANKMSTNSKRE